MSGSHKDKWSHIAQVWSLLRSPGRPSLSEVGIYKDFVLKVGEARSVLLLGATPELRDMFVELSEQVGGVELVCVDMVAGMFGAMQQLMLYKPLKNEVCLEGNWLDLSKLLPDTKFDVVLGDWVSVNVGNSRDQFYKEICSVLKPSGYFIERAGIITPNTPKVEKTFQDVLRVFNEQSVRAKSGEISRDQAWNYFASRLMMSTFYFNQDSKINWCEAYAEELEMLNSFILKTGDEVEVYLMSVFKKIFDASRGKYWVVLKQEDQEKLFSGFFEIKDKQVADDYDPLKAAESPIYLLRSK